MNLELLAWGDAGWADEMAAGMVMTITVAVLAFLFGLLLGVGGAALKLAKGRLWRILGDAYTTIVRGVPDLLIIYLVFFGGSGVVMSVARQFGYDGYIEVNALGAGMFALGVISGAYSTEVLRGAVLAVPRGQIEAAIACGMSRSLLFRRILFPQVARYALPGLGNVWQLTLKDTSLISIVGLVEIMRQASVASGSTREPFTFYLVAALLYMLLTSVSNRGFEAAERWANRGVRQA